MNVAVITLKAEGGHFPFLRRFGMGMGRQEIEPRLNIPKIISRDIAVTVSITVALYLCSLFVSSLLFSSSFGPVEVFAILFSGPFSLMALLSGLAIKLALYGLSLIHI